MATNYKNYGQNISYKEYTATYFKTHTCKNCGWKTTLQSKNDPPKVCSRCKHDPVTGEELDMTEFFHNEHADDDVKFSTHTQIHWTCRECGHYGFRWISNKEKTKELLCPNCNKASTYYKKVPRTGRSKSLWNNTVPRPVPKPKQNAYKCGECGNVQFFKHVRPRRCQACGYEYPVDNAEVPF
jgi:predicted Zn-ribbon and HTH transcriptional regulator